jgi:hypothetical protein
MAITENFRETAINYLTCDEYATFYSGEDKWKRKMRKYAEKYTDYVRITQDNDWGLIAQIPRTWLKVSPPRRLNMTDEQRAAAAERLANARVQKNNSK